MQYTPSLTELTQRNVETIAQMEKEFRNERTLGDNIADGVAKCVGSWSFIVVQSIFLVIWMLLNVIGWIYEWDPYPFILLNLFLSFQAAYASPIIMMSQNRQSKMQERRHRLDLQINILAEQENTEMLKLLGLLCQKLGVESEKTSSAQTLAQATKPEDLLRQIDDMIEPRH